MRGGIADLSLRELAAAIGTSHRMLLYHFGSREGLLTAVAQAVEEAQRAIVSEWGITSANSRRLWQHFSDPRLWPAERLFFELYAHALLGRPGTEGFLDNAIEPWVSALTPAFVREAGLDEATARAEARLAVAVTRGLLLDLLATGDRVATVPEGMNEHWRTAMFALTNLFLSMHRTFTGHEGLSPSVVLIYCTVSVGNIQKLMRERIVPREFTATAVLPREWVVPMSRSAIAAATGLPRETVRRHVAQMIDAGLLVEDPRSGVTVVPGAIQDRALEPLLEALVTEFSRTADALLRAGVIEVQSS